MLTGYIWFRFRINEKQDSEVGVATRLRTGRRRGRTSSPGKDKIFFFYMSSTSSYTMGSLEMLEKIHVQTLSLCKTSVIDVPS
jgi:hypothetical protein